MFRHLNMTTILKFHFNLHKRMYNEQCSAQHFYVWKIQYTTVNSRRLHIFPQRKKIVFPSQTTKRHVQIHLTCIKLNAMHVKDFDQLELFTLAMVENDLKAKQPVFSIKHQAQILSSNASLHVDCLV